jgi:5'-nucleotidase (lipoprotein e(P4) family)
VTSETSEKTVEAWKLFGKMLDDMTERVASAAEIELQKQEGLRVIGRTAALCLELNLDIEADAPRFYSMATPTRFVGASIRLREADSAVRRRYDRSVIRKTRSLWAAAVCGLLSACSTPSADQTPAGLDSVLWAHTSAEYRALSLQAFSVATLRLDESLLPENARWTAAVEQQGEFETLPPAVIVDVDDAILDTSEFQIEHLQGGGSFDIDRWNAWVEEANAPALPGSLAFAQHVHARGVRIFYVTNRAAGVEESVRKNLLARGFPVDASGENLLTKGEREGWGSDKTSRRAYLARTHRIVLMVGDDLNDFVLGKTSLEQRRLISDRYADYWGTKWILLPNPIYGTWERSIYDNETSITPEQILERKWRELASPPESPLESQLK